MRAALGALLALLAGCAAQAGGGAVPAAPVGGATGPAPVGAVVILEADAGGGARFAGSGACRACHREAWERWRATGHAADFAGLHGEDRADPACLRCHATGHGDPLGYRAGGPPGLDAVGCEACHGPSADHAESLHPGLVATAAGGPCPPCETGRVCRLCHTPARSPGFDLARDLARVSCPPADAAARH